MQANQKNNASMFTIPARSHELEQSEKNGLGTSRGAFPGAWFLGFAGVDFRILSPWDWRIHFDTFVGHLHCLNLVT